MLAQNCSEGALVTSHYWLPYTCVKCKQKALIHRDETATVCSQCGCPVPVAKFRKGAHEATQPAP